MDDLTPTFVFEGDDVFALLKGEVIASGKDLVEVEEAARPKVAAAREVAEQEKREHAKKTATHITTPNGVKGQILGRVSSTWGEQVTVRFENGEIRSFTTSGRETYSTEDMQKTASASPVDALRNTLDADYEHDKDGLRKRFTALKQISREASTYIADGVSHTDAERLNEIRVIADAEAQEVQEAYDHLETVDDQAFAPPAPFDPQAAEQATVGVRDDGSPWLDNAVADMVAEAEGVDYEKLLDEEPALFVTDLPDAVVADQGATADMAFAHVQAHTAAVGIAEPEKTAEYRKLFVARVEQARRAELVYRQKTTKREAAAKQETESNLPDDALFI